MSSENPLKIVIVGHVDHGKSTLVGRMLYETDSLEEGKYESIKATCEKRGVPFEWAFLMDALQAERNQNITIDTAQIWFESELRPYCIIDAPGHKEFLKNMVTGAANAEAALLLIAADEGVQEQSRRHGYMLSMLGIDQVAVVVNKMDLVDYDEERYENIVAEYSEFLDEIGIEPIAFQPTSARDGDNVVDAPVENMPWYDGPSVLDQLDSFERPKKLTERPMRFPIQDIYRFDDRRILAGRIESGQLEVGQELVFTPHLKRAKVESIERWHAPKSETAEAGESIGITLSEEIFVERGHVATTPDEMPNETARFHANVFWLGDDPLRLGEPYKLKLGTIEQECVVRQINRIMDGATLEPIEAERDFIARYDVAEVVIETRKPVAIDRYGSHPTTGRFVIVDEYDVAGGGIVAGVDESGAESERTTERVSAEEREARRGHRGAVVQLDGSRADELAARIERHLFERGMNVFYLDDVPGELQAEKVAEQFARAGVIVLVTGTFDSENRIVVDGEAALEYGGEAIDNPIVLIDRLLPELRTDVVEKKFQVTAGS